MCAGEDRARNAFENLGVCGPGVAQADIVQIGHLVDQARAAGPAAVAAGDLSSGNWADIEKELDPDKPQHLNPVTQALRRACRVFD